MYTYKPHKINILNKRKKGFSVGKIAFIAIIAAMLIGGFYILNQNKTITNESYSPPKVSQSLPERITSLYQNFFSDPKELMAKELTTLEMEGPNGNIQRRIIYKGETYYGIERIAKEGDSVLGLLGKTVNTLEKAGVNVIPIYKYGWTDNQITTINNPDKIFPGNKVKCYVKMPKGTNVHSFYDVALKYLNQ